MNPAPIPVPTVTSPCLSDDRLVLPLSRYSEDQRGQATIIEWGVKRKHDMRKSKPSSGEYQTRKSVFINNCINDNVTTSLLLYITTYFTPCSGPKPSPSRKDQRWIGGMAISSVPIFKSVLYTHVDSLDIITEEFLDFLTLDRGVDNNIVSGLLAW